MAQEKNGNHGLSHYQLDMNVMQGTDKSSWNSNIQSLRLVYYFSECPRLIGNIHFKITRNKITQTGDK